MKKILIAGILIACFFIHTTTMKPIHFIDRETSQIKEEKVFGEQALKFLYGNRIGHCLNTLLARVSLFSGLYGWWQKMPWTKGNISPFIDYFQIDSSEFLEPLDHFNSFNDFFIRKLKPEVRPIAEDNEIAVIPADARYLFFPNISQADGFIVKGEKFSLEALLKNPKVASRYDHGSMVIARLCPTDYHRFHFPVDCIPGNSSLINGYLYSVNPMALRQNIHIFTENKRTLCHLKTDHFGEVLFIEVGATNVGTIQQTYTPNQSHQKGCEKGYFSFGASSLIILFEPGKITFDQDLIDATQQGLEIRCLMGQRMGKG